MNYKNLILSALLFFSTLSSIAQISAKSLELEETANPSNTRKYDSSKNLSYYLHSQDDLDILIGQSIYFPNLHDPIFEKNEFTNTTFKIDKIYSRNQFTPEVISLTKTQSKKVIFYDIDSNEVIKKSNTKNLDERIIDFLFNQISEDKPALIKLESSKGDVLFILIRNLFEMNVFIEGFVIKAKENVGKDFVFDNPSKGIYIGGKQKKEFYGINLTTGKYIQIQHPSKWKFIDLQILNNPKKWRRSDEDDIEYNNNKDTFNVSYIDQVYRLYAIMQNDDGVQILIPSVDELDYHYTLSKIFSSEKNFLAKTKAHKEEQKAMTSIIKATHPAEYERLTQGNKFKSSMITKYGDKFGNAIIENKILIGMTKEMCLLAWGNPISANKTTTNDLTTIIMKYKYGKTLYLVNNKVTKIVE